MQYFFTVGFLSRALALDSNFNSLNNGSEMEFSLGPEGNRRGPLRRISWWADVDGTAMLSAVFGKKLGGPVTSIQELPERGCNVGFLVC